MAELAIMAATGLGASAGTAATIGTIASVGMTAVSAFSALSAGNSEAAALNLQAKQAGLNARVERLEGKRQALQIQDQLDRDLASQNALFAARGGLQGEGSAAAAEAISKERATQNIDAAMFDSEIAALNAEQRQKNLRAEAKSAKSQGMFNALTSIAGFSMPGTPAGFENFGKQATGAMIKPVRRPSLVGA